MKHLHYRNPVLNNASSTSRFSAKRFLWFAGETVQSVEVATEKVSWVDNQLADLKETIKGGLTKEECVSILQHFTNATFRTKYKTTEDGDLERGADGKPIEKSTPPTETPMNSARAMIAIQAGLKLLDCNPGAIDGLYGKTTKSAIKAFQESVFKDQPNEWEGIPGKKTIAKLIDKLRGGSGVVAPKQETINPTNEVVINGKIDLNIHAYGDNLYLDGHTHSVKSIKHVGDFTHFIYDPKDHEFPAITGMLNKAKTQLTLKTDEKATIVKNNGNYYALPAQVMPRKDKLKFNGKTSQEIIDNQDDSVEPEELLNHEIDAFSNPFGMSYAERLWVVLQTKLGRSQEVLNNQGEKYWTFIKNDLDTVQNKQRLKKVLKTMLRVIDSVDYTAKTKVDFLGWAIFKNKAYERWSSLQKFLYRREKDLPGMKNWLKGKINGYLQGMGDS